MLAGTTLKIILLDDEESFLQTCEYFLKMTFSSKIQIHSYSDSNRCLEFLRTSCYLPERPSEILEFYYAQDPSYDLTKRTLQDLLLTYGILIIDQNLQNTRILGIDIIKEIKPLYPSLKFILLTSCVEDKEAIEYHNSELIDAFINKNRPDCMEVLNNILHNLVEDFYSQFNGEAEEIFNTGNILDEERYIKQRESILRDNTYQSYITKTPCGTIALLNDDNELITYKFCPKQEAFVKNES